MTLKLYKDADDYIAVSMIVVLRQYQGQGYMKKILEPAFQEAGKRNCPCILDTDSLEKVAKYERCGMKKVAEKHVGHGVTLYTMEYKNMA
ncbi:MAG: GNAT family N-acetyltransferase [Clostridia bacterium]|nr:GNAT family N-acetyltransferase [Clostridia bacterium]